MNSSTYPEIAISEPVTAPGVDTGQQILSLLFNYRRSHEANEKAEDVYDDYAAVHLPKVLYFIEHNKPIHFILPAFPAKSPNRNKVLDIYPDMGEQLSLQFLKGLCEDIKKFYPAGGKITICSDGRVFSDLVSVPDEHVTLYAKGIQTILRDLNATCIDQFNLDDINDYQDYDRMREELVAAHGRNIDELKQAVQDDLSTKLLFNGIHKFLHEDLLAISGDQSKSQLKKLAKERAYHVIIRSNAWSSLIEKIFPRALRLSIHPQFASSKKIGIKLLDTEDAWKTPWHGVVLEEKSHYKLMGRAEAEALGAELIYINEQPSHYKLNTL